MARSNSTVIKVEGVRELTRALKVVSKEAPKAVAAAHKDVANLVVPVAQQYARTRPRKQRTGHIEATIRARGNQRSAVIAAGGARAPDIFVQEFGGKVPLFGDQSRKFTVRPRKKDGYFIYPAIRASEDRIEATYVKTLDEALFKYFSG